MPEIPTARPATPSPPTDDVARVGRGGPGAGGAGVFRLLGPAFVAAVAYVDPGNVAANVTAGARYGYLLLWVLVAGSAMAVLVQYLTARLGLVTGRSLAELMGQRYRRWPRRAAWLQAEIVAVATDLAEVIGGAIALQLLFGVPLPLGGMIVGLASMGLLAVQTRRGQRAFEGVIVTLLAVLAVGFLAGLFVAPIDAGDLASGLVPRFAGPDTVLLAASMLGATVMPHAIYAHSALARDRHVPRGALRDAGRDRRLAQLLRATRWDVLVALLVAGTVNVAMLVLAAASLPGQPGTDTIEGAHAVIAQALGAGIGTAFAVGLLASGLASTAVGAYAGGSIAGGLLHVRVPLVVRRAVTIVPAVVVLAVGIDPTWALVLSQVVLSLGIPFALVPLLRLVAARDLMGAWRVTGWLLAAAWVVVALVVALNVALVVLTVAG